jgi:hypothetical protein
MRRHATDAAQRPSTPGSTPTSETTASSPALASSPSADTTLARISAKLYDQGFRLVEVAPVPA